jgi:hypothetical protein
LRIESWRWCLLPHPSVLGFCFSWLSRENLESGQALPLGKKSAYH